MNLNNILRQAAILRHVEVFKLIIDRMDKKDIDIDIVISEVRRSDNLKIVNCFLMKINYSFSDLDFLMSRVGHIGDIKYAHLVLGYAKMLQKNECKYERFCMFEDEYITQIGFTETTAILHKNYEILKLIKEFNNALK